VNPAQPLLTRFALLSLPLTLAGCGPDGWLPLLPDWSQLDQPGWKRIDTARGRVNGDDQFRFFDLGPTLVGDDWRIEPSDRRSGAFNVALFDDQWNLLQRSTLRGGETLDHTLHRSAANLRLAVAGDGSFELRCQTRQPDSNAPEPKKTTQIVLLNFAGQRDLVVHGEDPLDLPAFEAADVWSGYDGQTELLQNAIVDTLQRHYRGFRVRFVRQRSEAPAGAAFSTLHFGGRHDYLLGLADQVDRYNADPGDSAIVFTGSFGQYVPIGLTVEDMGRFIGNVAAHELGHLLGLVHTQDPESVMDITGGVYDLAGARYFDSHPLEASVFPAGRDHAPRLLEETIGIEPGESLASVMKRQREQAASLRARSTTRVGAELLELAFAPPLHSCRGE
jgi:hypothetical protein